ncbi:MAG: tetratricopeptide repeat protein [Spirochaetales bacterium]|nr:tetratricopeptide repeat protein [Spirochaetales bacterium]
MFRWLFRKRKSTPDPDAFRLEHWRAQLAPSKDCRFQNEAGKGYSVKIAGQKAQLDIFRPRLFAWTIDPLYRYRDFVLEADLGIGAENGSSAAGLVFRYTNDLNYYYVLVSNTGRIRFDVVFNGQPIVLIPWTAHSLPLEKTFNLTVIAHGQHFSFYIDKNWVAEVADDHLDAGRVGWAGQNYADRPVASFDLHAFVLESRPVEVEAQYARWTRLVWTDPAQRRVLAQSFFSTGKFVEAEIQLRRVLVDNAPTRDDLFFLAQCALRQQRFDDALALVDQILAKDPGWELALKEKANLFYLQNRFLELHDALGPLLERFQDDDLLWNLAGHAHTGLGNFDRALEAYTRASQLNPRMPLYAVNAGRSLERLQRPDEAAERYVEAGHESFRQEAWDEVDEILDRLDFLGCGTLVGAQTLRAKQLFQRGETHQARPILEEALRKGSRDSAVPYLLAIAARDEGDLDLAIRYVRQAIEVEPHFYLYHFRLAEWLEKTSGDFEPSLQKALDQGSNDPWVLNFRGRTAANPAEKTFYLEKAHLALPEEPVITMNLADHYHSLGRSDEAFALLADWTEHAGMANLRGNLLSAERRFEEAAEAYDRALALEPRNLDFLRNAASCNLELERHLRAEELLITILDLEPSAQAYVAFGNLMRAIGDFIRSEVALRTALDWAPDDPQALLELGWLYLSRQKFSLVHGILSKLKSQAPREVQDLEASYRRLAGETLACAQCGLTWWVPLQLPLQPALKIRGHLPDSAPAGESEATGKIFCVGCAQQHMKEGRFFCPDSGKPLSLKDDRLKYLLRQCLEEPLP